ncbi:FG-GAP repeat domain-containing protein [Geopsychrobacter electrodiphilus]|uniref:FG-GAP repeat domain-containing protein n=1 Tax=Geopsychrobacter electrodiphilus TaxID=225196 RepID=UPI0003744CFA|nr:VCBS repeat-containing protein [Geopsychrobacter electrodiphilus]
MSSLKTLTFLLLLTCTLGVPSVAKALPSEIAHNLKPLDGVIVLPIDGEYLIDLDASKGVAVGDIFSIITPGPAIIHPVTGAVIGSLDKVEGWLEVTRIKSGYSYARPLNPKITFTKGTRIHRFKDLPAVFWDYSGSGEKLFDELRTALPQLEWNSYAKDQTSRPTEPAQVAFATPVLTFIDQGGQLQVRGASFQLLGQYALPALVAPTLQGATAATSLLPSGPVAAMTSAPKSGIVISHQEATPGGIVLNQTLNTDKIWSAADFKGNPTGLEIADFDQDGLNDIAILHRNDLEIGQITNRKYQRTILLPLTGIERALTLSSADLDGDGRPELFINAMDGVKVDSLIVAFKDGRFQIVQSNLPWFLHAITNPDGSKIVLGQRLGNRVDIFDPKVVKIEFKQGGYASAGEYPHPWQTTIFSLQPLNSADGKPIFAEISNNDQLRLFSPQAEVLWESSTNYGGSVVSFAQGDKSGARDAATMFISVQPRMALLDSNTILVPSNEGWKLSKALQSIGPGQITALRSDGNSMVELWHTTPQQGSLADFQYADIDNDHKPEVVLLMHYKSAGLLSKGNAGLKVFELN